MIQSGCRNHFLGFIGLFPIQKYSKLGGTFCIYMYSFLIFPSKYLFGFSDDMYLKDRV